MGRRARRWHRCKVRICVLEIEVYGRIVSESLRDEIRYEDTRSPGCLAADVRIAVGTCHLLVDRVRSDRLPVPLRPSPTVAVRG